MFTWHAQLLMFKSLATVLPAKSDRDDISCLQSYQGFVIDKSLNTHDLSICTSSSGVYKLVFDLAIVSTIIRHCHSWLARHYAKAFWYS